MNRQKYKSFEDIEIWQEARRIANRVYETTRGEGFSKDALLSSKIKEMALSVMSDIAEGYERGNDKEFSRFLAAAKGSCAALCSHLYIALDQGHIDTVIFEELTECFRNLSAAIDRNIIHSKEVRESSIIEDRPQRGSIKKELDAIFHKVEIERF